MVIYRFGCYFSVSRSASRGTSPAGKQLVWNISAKQATSRYPWRPVCCSFMSLTVVQTSHCSLWCCFFVSFLQILTEPVSKWKNVRGHNPLVTLTFPISCLCWCPLCSQMEGCACVSSSNEAPVTSVSMCLWKSARWNFSLTVFCVWKYACLFGFCLYVFRL